MYVVAGVSGNTGAVVANTLLAKGHPVRVLVRTAAKAEPWKKQGAEVAVADVNDTAALATALRGAKGAYLLLPPDYTSNTQLADKQRESDSIAAAVTQSGIPHVVFLSSTGAQHLSGTGVIQPLHYAEEKLKAAKTGVTVVRAAYFMENFGMVVQRVVEDDILPNFLDEHRKIPMVSVTDIGETAAKYLLEPTSDFRVIELAGPAEYSPSDAAEAFGNILDKLVMVATSPIDMVKPSMTSMGLPADLAGLMHEMYVGIHNGTVAWEGKPLVRGHVTLEQALTRLVKNAPPAA